MAYLTAFIILFAMFAVVWLAAVAFNNAYCGPPALPLSKDFWSVSAVWVGVVAATAILVPHPGGLVVNCLVWAACAFSWGLPPGRAGLLAAFLGASSYVVRLVIRGMWE